MKRTCATAFGSSAESSLRAQMEELRAQNEELRKQVAKQAEENSDIKKENMRLRVDLLYEQTTVNSLLEDEADCRELLDDADQVNQDLQKRIEELYRLSESSTVYTALYNRDVAGAVAALRELRPCKVRALCGYDVYDPIEDLRASLEQRAFPVEQRL